ncbi:hypothetical protein [Spiroplasma endosymbiont of Othius punctulatus]|uniref:hypothetical protein n=1 Tax=Spiroplasma endosymbiont of Othius punctulatus TaxID=3066289 RepID=UPI0030CBA615
MKKGLVLSGIILVLISVIITLIGTLIVIIAMFAASSLDASLVAAAIISTVFLVIFSGFHIALLVMSIIMLMKVIKGKDISKGLSLTTFIMAIVIGGFGVLFFIFSIFNGLIAIPLLIGGILGLVGITSKKN